MTGLITGSERYPGAAVLSCKAAAKTNIGMIRYMGPQVCRDMVLAAVPEAVLGKGRVQAWVVGSGVPTGETEDDDFQRETIAKLLTHYALSSDDDPDDDDDLAYDMPPLVVDAGALDLLPDEVPPQVVITPHAGELASLLTARGEDVDASDVQNEPLHWALRAHELTGATVLLKGAVTIVVGEPADTDRESDAQGGFADDEQHVRVVVSGRAPAWLGTAGRAMCSPACWGVARPTGRRGRFGSRCRRLRCLPARICSRSGVAVGSARVHAPDDLRFR